MKKFITFIPMQTGSNLLLGKYAADGNTHLCFDRPIRFPVLAMLNGYVEDNERIELLAIMEENNSDCLHNLELLQNDISEILAGRNAHCTITPIEISKQETSTAHLNTFAKLIDNIQDNDEVFACITFGTKPTPILELMAMHFAYKTKNNMKVRCIAYGKVNRKGNAPDSFCIYDVTALFFMLEIVDKLAELQDPVPEESIRRILNIEDTQDADV